MIQSLCNPTVCVSVLLHLQHLLQVFPALGSQGCEVSLFLTQRLLSGGQLSPHGFKLLLHLLHGPQQLLHLGTPTHTHTNSSMMIGVDYLKSTREKDGAFFVFQKRHSG